LVGTAAVGCKNQDPATESETLNVSEEVQKKIAEDIRSFNDTQKALIEANKRGDPACAKLDILWQQIMRTRQEDADILPPNSNFADVVVFGNGSANRFWRIFEGWKESEGGSEIRPEDDGTRRFIRLTHRFGVLAKMKFVVDKEAVTKLGYTGHYGEGNDCVLGRLSSAVPTSVPDRFTPALSAKFFVGGSSESQVLITQHDIGGQSSGTDMTVNPPRPKTIDNNFYTHALSNRLSFENGVPSGTGAFSRFFYAAQVFGQKFGLKYIVDPRELQANHLALKSPSGKVIPKEQAKGPRFVWTVAPSTDAKAKFAAMAAQESDFRKHFLSLNRAGTTHTVFNVYASDTWTYEPEKDATLIGKLVTASPFVVSEAADVRLFFKHSFEFRRLEEAEGKPNVYTQDYPYEEWGKELFTGDCRLGVLENEVQPSWYSPLDGTFLYGAIVDPTTRRYAKDGSNCFFNFVSKRLEGPLEEKRKEFEERRKEIEDALAPYLIKM
jgi:hypothetical protein